MQSVFPLAWPSSWPEPTAERLEGSHVLLQRLDPDRDLEDLYELSHGSPDDEAIWTYMLYGPFKNKNEMAEWIRSVASLKDPRFYSVFSKQHGRRVGMYAVMNISMRHGRAELGNIWYSRVAQRTIVNTEATFLFLSYLFDDLKYRRVEWKCDDRNEASKNAARRLGFSFEGLFRQHMIVKGKNRDTAWFAMLDSEWPERKKNFERYFAFPTLSLSRLNGNL